MNYFLVKFGAVMAGGGVVLAAYKATNGLVLGNNPAADALGAVMAQQGPLEICAIGILLWIMGKWRIHTAVD